MALSEEDRRALHDRANGLRGEITSLKVGRDEALIEASEAQRDAKLIAEVTRLQDERDQMADEKSQADGSVEAALAIMNSIAGTPVVTPAEPVEVAEVEVPDDAPLLGAVIDTESKEG